MLETIIASVIGVTGAAFIIFLLLEAGDVVSKKYRKFRGKPEPTLDEEIKANRNALWRLPIYFLLFLIGMWIISLFTEV